MASLSQGRTAAAQCGLFTPNQSRSYLNHLVFCNNILLYKKQACRQGPIPFSKSSLLNFNIFDKFVPSRVPQSIIRVSARNRGINRQSFDIPRKIPYALETLREFLPGNWQYFSILRVLPTACLFCTYFRV